MNKFKILNIAVAIFLLASTSCNESFLEPSPQGQLTSSQLNSTNGVEQR